MIYKFNIKIYMFWYVLCLLLFFCLISMIVVIILLLILIGIVKILSARMSDGLSEWCEFATS